MYKKYKKYIVNVISKYIPECKIYLFGIHIKKNSEEQLRIDIAIDYELFKDLDILAQIYEEVRRSKQPLVVDIVHLNSVSDETRKAILSKGVLLN